MSAAPRSAPPAHLIVSPHPDDAVWSSGGRIARWIAAGEPVTLLTIFDGPGPAAPSAGWLASATHRRREDRAAAALLGVHYVSAQLPEALRRSDAAGPRYPNPLRIFGPRVAADDPVVAEVRLRVVHHLPPGGWLHAPLSMGGHVDHAIVREAVETIPGCAVRTTWYEDFPYRHRRGRPPTEGLTPVVEAVELGPWLAASACYASQSRLMFGGTEELLAAITGRAARHAATVGRSYGERVWLADPLRPSLG